MQTQHLEAMDRMVEYRVSSLAASMEAAHQESLLLSRARVRLGRMLVRLGTLLDNECRELVTPAQASGQKDLAPRSRALSTCA
jgi:hypothetical protein